MLATLLIFRQFLQNIKEVLQPYLYEHHKLGVFTPKVVWEILQAIVLKYSRLALGKAQASWTIQSLLSPKGPATLPGQTEQKKRGDLKAGYRFTEAEWDINYTLKQRKISFNEKVHVARDIALATQPEDSFLEDSPTLVEEGMDPSSIFEMGDDDSDYELSETKETKETSVSPPSGYDTVVCQRRKNPIPEKESTKSWIDPPEEPKSVILTQAEMESCMQTYEVWLSCQICSCELDLLSVYQCNTVH